MKDIKFIKKITDYVMRDRVIVGNCVYYNLENGNKVKLYCYDNGVKAEVINKVNGKIDDIDFPFANYFEPTQCSANSPKWTQHIDGDKWYFENTYNHVLPKNNDYINLAVALSVYIEMYN